MNFANVLVFFISFFTSGYNQAFSHESNSEDKLTEIRCQTSPVVHEINYFWTIRNFDLIEAKNETIYSPHFSASTNDKFKWYFTLFPNGIDCDEKGHIDVFLNFRSYCQDKEVLARYYLSALDNEQNILWSWTSKIRKFVHSGPGWGYTGIIPKEKVILPDGTLKIFCKITFSTVNCSTHHSIDGSPPNELSIPKCNFSQNLATLFKNKTLADVTLWVNGEIYPAHKVILAAHSSFFASMFNNDVKNEKIKRINITNTSEEVLNEMLRYIYTGECENLERIAADLLVAADKYGVNRLKMICADTLSKNLTVDNVTNVLMVADKHGVNELKSNAIEFIAANYVEVSNSESWKNIKKENPQFILRVLHDFLSSSP